MEFIGDFMDSAIFRSFLSTASYMHWLKVPFFRLSQQLSQHLDNAKERIQELNLDYMAKKDMTEMIEGVNIL